jgi:hypothetical protein
MRPCSDKRTGRVEVLVWPEEEQQCRERGPVPEEDGKRNETRLRRLSLVRDEHVRKL